VETSAEACVASTGLALFRAAVAEAGTGPAIHYFDRTLSYAELDRLSDGLAAYLSQLGFEAGDRLALYLQNTPHFVISLLAGWKLGGVCVPINPMNLERELSLIFEDCTPKALICNDHLLCRVHALPAAVPPIVIPVASCEFQSRNDPRIADWEAGAGVETVNFEALGTTGDSPPAHYVRASDIALIVYTSGTTGRPKGAVIKQSAFAVNAPAFREVAQLDTGDCVLGVAPLFHITGLAVCLALSFVLRSAIILTYRFHPSLVLDAIGEHRPRFLVAAITAYIAMANDPQAKPESFAPLDRLYSGGAPVPPAFVAEFEEKFGRYIHNCYGMTETCGPTHIVPFGVRAPLSADGTTLSVGKPVPGLRAHAVDDEGGPCCEDAAGELTVAGPMLLTNYWQKPEETAQAICDGRFRTGDVAIVDREDWCFLVDRKKDMIVSSGYKVWPREVEDVLYTHPMVREAAVVGVPDRYRGETVKAIVSLKPGAAVSPEDLCDYCSTRMATYKRPRLVEIREELPKTMSGKILRFRLRE
jgi:long-chain acyl-CoA synthetase